VGAEHAALRRWFEEFQVCVRAADFAAGRAFFADDAVAFGTKADVVTGLDAIVAGQWQPTWPNIADFTFQVDELQTGHEGNLAWAVLPWTSTGYYPDGTAFDRPGRATLVFVRRDGRWLVKHSHFSLNPGTPPTTHGQRR
jgi:ketosteroid isomerase-like protein